MNSYRVVFVDIQFKVDPAVGGIEDPESLREVSSVSEILLL